MAKKFIIKDVWVLDIKHRMLIGTKTIYDYDFVVNLTKPTNDNNKMIILCSEECQVIMKCDVMKNYPNVWSKYNFDLDLYMFNLLEIKLSNEEISKHKQCNLLLLMRN